MGIWVGTGARNTTIGGTTVADRNVIAYNFNHGIGISSSGTGTQILGNYIGVDASGLNDAGNRWYGIELRNAPGVTIGGTTAEARNVIAGNSGISINGTDPQTRSSKATISVVDHTGLKTLPASEMGVFIGDGDLIGVAGEDSPRNITVAAASLGQGM